MCDFPGCINPEKGGKGPYSHLCTVCSGEDERKSRKTKKVYHKKKSKKNEKKKGKNEVAHKPCPSYKKAYEKYLKSDKWFKIKSRILKASPNCEICGCEAEVVHHTSYSKDVLKGHDDSKLKSLCNSCHYNLHFGKDGKKLTMKQSNIKLNGLT